MARRNYSGCSNFFYGEFDFPSKGVVNILNGPDFDLAQTPEGQKTAMKARKKRVTGMLTTIDKTILKLKGKIKMAHEELYAGVPKDKAVAW
ncbi:hypothetical protein [Sinomicrobium weinanense]|uniref:hypothetical protein n=1 Tax=Sinomicrobium weinanense TaxID=2842200 RepID=UPI001C0C7FAE|nr:hypothetical protein [Sinomicrobium weinanense]MBU3123794.1 hypothetical protein [Sinomicrobium weinanense]